MRRIFPPCSSLRKLAYTFEIHAAAPGDRTGAIRDLAYCKYFFTKVIDRTCCRWSPWMPMCKRGLYFSKGDSSSCV